MMNEKEYQDKFENLRILKNTQDYLAKAEKCATAVFPIKVPNDFFILALEKYGPEKTDKLIHHIFEMGLKQWSEQLYQEAFGSEGDLKNFIELVKERNNK